MIKPFLVVTSIADQDHPILNLIAKDAKRNNVPFIVIGDTKSPKEFHIDACDFYSIEQQEKLNFTLARAVPYKHYSRKNLGYLIAMSKGANCIIETDDDNIPLESFWETRSKQTKAHLIKNENWVNIYKYFTDVNIWPRGFALDCINNPLPVLQESETVESFIHQGLADDNPDVDAIYRLILPLPITFNKSEKIALGKNSFCPFNSQNTTWFKEAFPLLYLPSYCSFRMTDIWRSFVAQRIAWSCGWNILFHSSTVRQERNDHSLMLDFQDEIAGYVNNDSIFKNLKNLNLKEGVEHIPENLILCYKKLVDLELVAQEELNLLNAWLKDLQAISEI